MSFTYQLGQSCKDTGNAAMAFGAVVVGIGLIDGPIPDGEVVGGLIVAAGGATYLAGAALEAIAE